MGEGSPRRSRRPASRAPAGGGGDWEKCKGRGNPRAHSEMGEGSPPRPRGRSGRSPGINVALSTLILFLLRCLPAVGLRPCRQRCSSAHSSSQLKCQFSKFIHDCVNLKDTYEAKFRPPNISLGKSATESKKRDPSRYRSTDLGTSPPTFKSTQPFRSRRCVPKSTLPNPYGASITGN